MTDRLLPSVFVSHGSPTIALPDSPIRPFFAQLGETLGRPRGIVCVSAHWEASKPAVSATPTPDTIYDFQGFPQALYEMTYPAPGAPGLAAHVAELLGVAGTECVINRNRGLDHGAWVPLMMMYPEADIPVTQLSVQTLEGADHHLALGRAIQELREEGILILASGSAVHNLSNFRDPNADNPDWAEDFEEWLVARVLEGDTDSLLNYRSIHQFAEKAHPTEEHYFPLLVALGAGANAGQGHLLYRGFMVPGISMAAFAFN